MAGLQDPDLQQRRRYLHLITDEAPRKLFFARAAVLRTIRRVLDERGFVEFEGPMLQTIAGGANARPFTTHHFALDMPMKLRISLELYLKRMLVGGVDRVFELGRNFRNEGIDRDHNPEFTMLEAYQAYGDYHSMMELSETLVRESCRTVNPILGRAADDLVIPRAVRWSTWPSRSSGSPCSARSRMPSARRSPSTVPTSAASPSATTSPSTTRGGPARSCRSCSRSWSRRRSCSRRSLRFPGEVSPLARPHRDDPGLTEHFDLVAGGLELVTAFSELTDPDEQRAKFELQQQMKEVLGDEDAPLDEEFLRALEHGMPPAGGLGMGIDRLLLLLTDAPSLRDLIMFPAQRPEGRPEGQPE